MVTAGAELGPGEAATSRSLLPVESALEQVRGDELNVNQFI